MATSSGVVMRPVANPPIPAMIAGASVLLRLTSAAFAAP
jgi:hypothetical protein